MDHKVAVALTSAAAFSWFGLVLGISGLEARRKFRGLEAAGMNKEVASRLAVGIGQLVFKAVNFTEGVFFLAILVAAAAGSPKAPVAVFAGIVLLLWSVQMAAVRPVLNRHTKRVLKRKVVIADTKVGPDQQLSRLEVVTPAGEKKKGRAHVVYIVLDAMKLLALIALGTAALAAG
ncbi:hypothetical protein ACF07Y_39205 [Streptomyces sp. NPDC016566]|uniref:hypothetical protein n=1 Tax=Streptomyces sp. NPDC016566 TaxID=3364967 RepID=UPI0036FC4D59